MSEVPQEEKLPEFCTSDNLIDDATEEDLRALAEISHNATCTKRFGYLYFKSGEVGRTWKIFVTETGKLYLAERERGDDIKVLGEKINKVKTRDELVGRFRKLLDQYLTEKGGINSKKARDGLVEQFRKLLDQLTKKDGTDSASEIPDAGEKQEKKP